MDQAQPLVALDPLFITGFTDGEGTFTISITKDNRERKTTRRLLNNIDREIFSVHPSFSISLNYKDHDLIKNIHSYFKVGKIKNDLSNNAITFYVNSIEDLSNIIIPFFDNNSLITQKQADFLLFKSAVELINKGEHLTKEGIEKLINIKASMNKGLSDKLKKNFPNFIPVVRPIVTNQEIKDANWLAGFTTGEGSFYIRTKKAETEKSINRVSFFFSIVQSNRDRLLISNISKYLNCGTISNNTKYTQFRVTKFEDIDEKIISFFHKYSLHGIKKLNFEDFCVVMAMVKSKVHLTFEGFEKIEKIISGMNLKRK
nr:hypothetical protein [Arthrobotrys musiformis]QBM31529.1 hypothetical protein [Arthrobotrys musiformis]QBM31679.1 hypothetical protein [Arthrobotrys musiformis]